MNNEGYFNIVGRIKELIIRGGENIYPQEIENFLLQHKSISEAYVFGIPDARFGEEICSWIKLKEDAEKIDESDVRNYLKERVSMNYLSLKTCYLFNFITFLGNLF